MNKENKIEDLEQKIIEINQKNKEIRKIKNIKIFKERFKVAVPFILSGTLALTYFNLTFDKYCKFPAPCTVYTTSNQYQFTMYVDEDNENYNCGSWTLDDCSKWYQNEDGSYSRKITTYQNNENCPHSPKELEEIVLNKDFEGKQMHFTKEHFMKKTVETKELTQDEVENNSNYMEVTCDTENETKTVTKFPYLWGSTLLLSSQLFGIVPYSFMRKKHLKKLKEIRKTYSEIDTTKMSEDLRNLEISGGVNNKKLIRK